MSTETKTEAPAPGKDLKKVFTEILAALPPEVRVVADRVIEPLGGVLEAMGIVDQETIKTAKDALTQSLKTDALPSFIMNPVVKEAHDNLVKACMADNRMLIIAVEMTDKSGLYLSSFGDNEFAKHTVYHIRNKLF